MSSEQDIIEESDDEDMPNTKDRGTPSKQQIMALYGKGSHSSIPRFVNALRAQGYRLSVKQARKALAKFKEISDAEIQQLWQDPTFGLIGPATFRKKLVAEGYRVSTAQVERALAADATRDILQQRRTNRKSVLPIYANEDGQYMADLAFLPKLRASNKGYGILLTIINMNTGKAYAYPLKGKQAKKRGKVDDELTDAEEIPDSDDDDDDEQQRPTAPAANVYSALKDFFRTAKPKVTTFQTDQGSEFLSKDMKALYTKHGIDHITLISGQNHNAMGKIERLNRTLKSRLNAYMIEKGHNRWTEGLDAVLQNYNDTPNSGNPESQSPNDMDADDVLRKRIAARFRAHELVFKDRIDYKGEGGDDDKKDAKVRIRTNLTKGTFDKESAPWSSEVYTVVDGDGLGYVLEDSKGQKQRRKYKAYELKVTTATKRRNAIVETKKEGEKKSKVASKVKRNLEVLSAGASRPLGKRIRKKPKIMDL